MTIQDEAGLAGLLAQADAAGNARRSRGSPQRWSGWPRAAPKTDLAAADAFVWQAAAATLHPGRQGQPGRARSCCAGSTGRATFLVENTERFAHGLPANNALLWGARGMGKSSLVKAAHAEINRRLPRRQTSAPLKLSRSTARTSTACRR